MHIDSHLEGYLLTLEFLIMFQVDLFRNIPFSAHLIHLGNTAMSAFSPKAAILL